MDGRLIGALPPSHRFARGESRKWDGRPALLALRLGARSVQAVLAAFSPGPRHTRGSSETGVARYAHRPRRRCGRGMVPLGVCALGDQRGRRRGRGAAHPLLGGSDLRILIVVTSSVDGGVFGVEGDMPELGACCGSARRQLGRRTRLQAPERARAPCRRRRRGAPRLRRDGRA